MKTLLIVIAALTALAAPATAQSKIELSELKIQKVVVARSNIYNEIRTMVTVKNTGTSTSRRIGVTVTYLNDAGFAVDSWYLESAPLAPGQSRVLTEVANVEKANWREVTKASAAVTSGGA